MKPGPRSVAYGAEMPPGATAPKCRPWQEFPENFLYYFRQNFWWPFFFAFPVFFLFPKILILRAGHFAAPLPLAITLLVTVLCYFPSFFFYFYYFLLYFFDFFQHSTLFCRPCTSAARGDSPPLPPSVRHWSIDNLLTYLSGHLLCRNHFFSFYIPLDWRINYHTMDSIINYWVHFTEEGLDLPSKPLVKLFPHNQACM